MYKWCETIYIYFALSVRQPSLFCFENMFNSHTQQQHSSTLTHTHVRVLWISTIYTNICVENESQSVQCLSNRSQNTYTRSLQRMTLPLDSIFPSSSCLFQARLGTFGVNGQDSDLTGSLFAGNRFPACVEHVNTDLDREPLPRSSLAPISRASFDVAPNEICTVQVHSLRRYACCVLCIPILHMYSNWRTIYWWNSDVRPQTWLVHTDGQKHQY